MVAEWCEYDPIVKTITVEGEEVTAHVVVTVHNTPEDRAIYHDWHKEHRLNVVPDGDGGIVVVGPPCAFRTWAEVRHPEPVRIWGEPRKTRAPLERVVIELT